MDATLADALQRHQLGPLADLLEPLWWPATALRFEPVALADLTPGASRAGGLPDLAPGFAWPTYREWPLPFLLQLDLGVVAHLLGETALPAAGWLVLFGVADEKAPGVPDWLRSHAGFVGADVFQVRYVAGPVEALVRTPAPAGSLELPCHATAMAAVRSLPTASSPHVQAGLRALEKPATVAPPAPGDSQPPRKLSSRPPRGGSGRPPAVTPTQRYGELRDEIAGVRDHVLGHPTSIQDDVLVEATMESEGRTFPLPPEGLEAVYQAARRWRLLLQLDANTPRGWHFASDGRLYIALPDADLRAQRFDRARVVVQR